ncbi:hypothetical protein PMO31116_01429 [Pandoraea morbifera]|uniref:Uncharacterized protein n=2 Tax=Pandoraea morbifera TaxID=2508300 RepID=A0A5E4TI27_9BURK|nr:hypothetical protein PMO31116_01429 [Pandoraea morbifera]
MPNAISGRLPPPRDLAKLPPHARIGHAKRGVCVSYGGMDFRLPPQQNTRTDKFVSREKRGPKPRRWGAFAARVRAVFAGLTVLRWVVTLHRPTRLPPAPGAPGAAREDPRFEPMRVVPSLTVRAAVRPDTPARGEITAQRPREAAVRRTESGSTLNVQGKRTSAANGDGLTLRRGAQGADVPPARAMSLGIPPAPDLRPPPAPPKR